MRRPVIWGAVAALVLAAGVGLWIASAFEPVPVRRRDAPQGEARRDRYLALTRFLVRLGRPATRVFQWSALDLSEPRGVLIVDRGRAYQISEARATAVWAWVRRGGYLVLVPEAPGTPDPLTNHLGVTRDEDPSATRDGAPGAPGGAGARRRTPVREVTIPGFQSPLRIAAFPGLRPAGLPAEWSAGDDEAGGQVLHFTRGAGAATVIEGLNAIAANDRIGELDHAEFLWRLIERYGPDGPVTLLSPDGVPSLWAWLGSHARAAIAAFGATVILWLWSVVPRFGPAVPAPLPQRRELREHLAAVGRFVWTRGGPDSWVRSVRRTMSERIAARWPMLAGDADRNRVLASHTGLPAGDIHLALDADAADEARFVATVDALRRLERRL